MAGEIVAIQIEDKSLGEEDEKSPLKLPDNNNLEQSVKFLPSVKGDVISPIKNSKLVKNNGRRRYTGIFLAIAAGIFMTLSMVIVKVLSHYHPFALTMWRYAFNSLLGLPIIAYFHFWKKSSPFTSIWPSTKTPRENWMGIIWLLLACATGTSTFMLRYYSMIYLSVADSTVIAYSGPLVIVFLAHFFLGEKCGVVSILVAIWTFLGVFAISRPPMLTGEKEFSPDTLLGTGLALAGMIFGSICIILLRKVRQFQFSITILFAGVWGTIQSGVFSLFIGYIQVPDNWEDILLILAMSLLSFLGGLCVTLAVKFEQAGPYALIRSGDIIFAFAWQFLFLSVIPDLASIIGALIVITGIVVTTMRKWVSTLPEGNRTRHAFRFLLY